jgi:hypothetical protein
VNHHAKSALIETAPLIAAILVAFGLLFAHAAVNIPKLPRGLTAAPQPPSYSFGLAWTESPDAEVTGYRLYISNTKTNPLWRLLLQTVRTNTVRVTVTNLPVWFVCRAFDAAGTESDDSNMAGMIGRDQVLTVWSEISSNSTTWQKLAPISAVTNPVGSAFFRVGANLTNRWRTE